MELTEQQARDLYHAKLAQLEREAFGDRAVIAFGEAYESYLVQNTLTLLGAAAGVELIAIGAGAFAAAPVAAALMVGFGSYAVYQAFAGAVPSRQDIQSKSSIAVTWAESAGLDALTNRLEKAITTRATLGMPAYFPPSEVVHAMKDWAERDLQKVSQELDRLTGGAGAGQTINEAEDLQNSDSRSPIPIEDPDRGDEARIWYIHASTGEALTPAIELGPSESVKSNSGTDYDYGYGGDLGNGGGDGSETESESD